ncbi:MAG: class I SAM-dependent methyltransferase [Agarilytica sp.]
MSEMQHCIVTSSIAREQEAKAFAVLHGLPYIENANDKDHNVICFAYEGVYLHAPYGKKGLELKISFTDGAVDHRRKFGGGKGQMISKAVGLSKGFVPHVLDVTAGLGRDAFVLASLGAKVDMYERSPIVHILLDDALVRARSFANEESDTALGAIVSRMSLQACDSREKLSETKDAYDVVYLDPMFPDRKKSAAVKKDMQIFHDIVGCDEDADALLAPAIDAARYRVVVKRPRIAPDLAGEKPNYRLEGKSSRFDIYTKKAFPV